jgi:glutathione S-transferase
VPTLYVIHHSPWSERARWALLHHKVAFDEREHVPLIGELALRMKTPVKGKASVPLLVSDDVAVQGSLAIAEWVDERGKRDTLFPEGSRDRIESLYETVEDGLCAARERFVRDLMHDEEAQIEALPPFLRGLPMATMSAKIGTAFIASKYNARIGSVDDRIRAGMRAVREALAGKDYVFESFSFADIIGASMVQGVAPANDKYLDLPPATRRLWKHEKLTKEFEDLITWRDKLYDKHRPKKREKP